MADFRSQAYECGEHDVIEPKPSRCRNASSAQTGIFHGCRRQILYLCSRNIIAQVESNKLAKPGTSKHLLLHIETATDRHTCLHSRQASKQQLRGPTESNPESMFRSQILAQQIQVEATRSVVFLA